MCILQMLNILEFFRVKLLYTKACVQINLNIQKLKISSTMAGPRQRFKPLPTVHLTRLAHIWILTNLISTIVRYDNFQISGKILICNLPPLIYGSNTLKFGNYFFSDNRYNFSIKMTGEFIPYFCSIISFWKASDLTNNIFTIMYKHRHLTACIDEFDGVVHMITNGQLKNRIR